MKCHILILTDIENIVTMLLEKMISTGGNMDAFPVTIDYSMTLSQMIAVGGYGYVNALFEPSYVVTGSGIFKVDIELVLLELGVFETQVDVDSALEARGYRCAKIEEFLALGAQHRLLLSAAEVIAGPIANESLPCLIEEAGHRRISFYSMRGGRNMGAIYFVAARVR